MSIRIMSMVWETKCSSHTQKLVLLALADNANDQHICWPSAAHLATKCDLTKQAVLSQIQRLTLDGHLRTEKTPGKKTYYTVLPTRTGQPRLPVNGNDRSTPLTTPVNGVDHYRSTPLTGPVNAVDLNHKEPSTNHHQPPKVEKGEKRFVKPTIEEMVAHGAKIDLPEDQARACWNYYESNGWRVGRNPMKSWNGAMQTWKQNWKDRHANQNTQANRSSSPAKYQNATKQPNAAEVLARRAARNGTHPKAGDSMAT